MATWATLDITPDQIRGIAEFDFTDTDGEFDFGQISDRVKDAAKRLVRTKVSTKIPSFILQKGGPEAFFDAVAASADSGEDLEVLVTEMLVYAFLHQWAYSEHPASFSRLNQDAEYYMERLMESVNAFCALAPSLILAADELVNRPSSTVVTSSSPDYYGYE